MKKMMTKSKWKFVDEWRNRNVRISDEEAEEVYRYCSRKMEKAGVENPSAYIIILYPDELKDYIARTAINAKSMIGLLEKEDALYV